MLATPSMLVRTTLYALLAQLLVISVVASAVPRGAAWLTVAGFVTPYYDRNIFAVRIFPVPWTDPAVYISVQTLAQLLAVSLAVSALITLARTNPWQHGALPDSTPPAKETPLAPKKPASDPQSSPPGPPAVVPPPAAPSP